METIAEVRPEDGAPEISVIAPRGSPPVSASRGAIPVGTLSKTRRSRSVNGDGIRSRSADSKRARNCINVNRERFRCTEQAYGSQQPWENEIRRRPLH